jgi:DNA repair exonuclease SbcCD ATPase subunit
MILEKLIIKNFMRIKETELDFSDKTIVGIRAEGIDDPERSNYIGKTTLMEAVYFCVTGRSRADKDIELIHDGEEVMEVITVWKDVNGNSHKIRRGRDIKNNGVIEVGFADKGKDPQQAIDDLFGITADDLEQIFFFKQQEIHEFMNLTADRKKKLMMKWLKNDHWKDKETAVGEDVKAKKTLIYEKQLIVKNAEIAVGDEQNVMDMYSSAKTTLGMEATALVKLRGQIDEASGGMTRKQYDQHRAAREKIQQRIDTISERVHAQEERIKRYEGIKLDPKYDTVEKVLAEKKKYEDGKLKLKESALNIKVESKELSFKLEDIKLNKGMCPILKKSCDLIKPEGTAEEIQTKLTANAKKIAEAEDKIAKCENTLAAIKKHEEALSTKAILKKQIDESIDYKEEVRELDKEFTEHGKKMEEYDPEAEERVLELKMEASQIEERIAQVERIIGGLEQKMKVVDANKDTLAKARSEIIDLNTELGDLQYLAFMFGRNGIPSLEIENAFTEIENDVNYILDLINPDIRVTIRPEKELQAWEPNCPTCGFMFPKGYRKSECEQCDTPRMKKRKDELTFVVEDKGVERSFKMCSGGLKTVISLAVRVALSLLVKRQNKTNFSTIFLDEIDSALDATHKEQIKDLVVRVLVNQLGFAQVLWISHDKTISQSVPHTILVKGYKNHSELEWV